MPLSLSSHLRVPEDVVFRNLRGESVLLNLKTGTYYGLDSVGTLIWGMIEQNNPLDQIVSALTSDYDVGAERCAQDLLDLVAEMLDKGLIELAT